MGAVSSHGATFTFSGFSALISSVKVEEGQGEVVDMTGINDSLTAKKMVGTGALMSPHKVSIEFMRTETTPQPLVISGTTGSLSISGPMALTRLATCDSMSHEMKVGDLVRGNASFIVYQT